MPRELPPTGYYRQRIRSVIASGTVSVNCPEVSGNNSYVPSYRPDNWNDNENVRRKNNCYNYANSLVTNNYALPGRESSNNYSSITADAVRDAAVRDGLVVLSPHPAADDPVPAALGGGSYLVALFMAPS